LPDCVGYNVCHDVGMGTATATVRRRQPGSLQRVTRRARGHEYPMWRWRTYRRGDLGWQRVDLPLGDRLTGLRTRTYVALGRLSAPLLVERWARWHFRSWSDLPSWTGLPSGSQQRALWWLEIPRTRDGSIRLRFRSLDRGGYDFRRVRSSISTAEQTATDIYRDLTDDPCLELARLLWLEQQGQQQVDAIAQEQLELRRQRRQGDLNQRDFEADERDTYLRLDGWEHMTATVQRRHDDLLEQVVQAAARPERDDIRRQVLVLVDRYLHDGRQQSRWHADHWDDHTLRW